MRGSVFIVALLAAAGVTGFAVVVIGVAMTVEFDWPRRLLGLFVCAIGIAAMFISFIGISSEIGA